MKVLIRSNMTSNPQIDKEKAIISDGLSCVAPLQTKDATINR